MVPRLGAFEVSYVWTHPGTNVRYDVLLYSKLMSQVWPHTDALGARIGKMFEEIDTEELHKCEDAKCRDFFKKYQFKGVVVTGKAQKSDK